MKELQIFNDPEFGQIRTIELDGEPWLVGKDVAAALGYSNTKDALARHVDPEDKRGSRFTTPSGEQELTIINESGLYSLVLSSKLPGARKFRRWVTSEVLPSIRKSNGYINGQENLTDAEIMAKALLVAQRTIEQRDRQMKALEASNSALTVDSQIMQPKAEYFDELVDRNLLTNFTEAAKQIGISRKAMINFMLDHSYLYHDKKGNLLPYANKKTEGLFEVKQCTNQKTGWAGCQTLMTPKGVETFRLLCQGI